ncbi:MAG: hypothetical protein EU547_03925 [Promethearchaeota archaeon]|nr:MAG: hypothetical protein EU547_03925 [Candidatus Lokiarchaeota archaeon]
MDIFSNKNVNNNTNKPSRKYHLIVLPSVFIILGLYVLFSSFLCRDWFRNNIVYAQIGFFSPYYFIIAIISFVFACLMLYRSIMFEYKSLIFFIIALFLISFSYFFGWLNWNPDPTGEIPKTGLYEAQVLFSTVSLFLLFIHFELNEYETPRTTLTSIVSLCLVPLSFKNIYAMITRDYLLNEFKLIQFGANLVQAGGIIIFLSIFAIGIKMLRVFTVHNKKAQILFSLQYAGLMFLFFHGIFELLEGILKFFIDFSIYNTPIVIGGMLLIGISYSISPKHNFMSPNVKAFGVVDKNGISHYFIATSEEFAEKKNVSEELFGGLTVALKSVGKAVAQTEKNVNSLTFKDRAIIIEYIEPYYLVLIAEKASYFMHLEMKEYLEDLKKLYPEIPKYGTIIDDEIFEQLNTRFYPIQTPYYLSQIDLQNK